ncbi:MAG: YVTN family beta-propeller protein, partial [Myxococcota bacterium]
MRRPTPLSLFRQLTVLGLALAALAPTASAEEMILMAGEIPEDLREVTGKPDVTLASPLARAAHRPWLTGSSIALSRDESNVLVVDTDNRTLTVSDIDSGAVLHRVPVGRMPERVVVGLRNLAYVTNRGSRSVSVVDIVTGKEVRSLQAGVEPYGIALTPDGGTLVVVASASREILIFDTGSLALRFRIETEGAWPAAVAAHPDGRRAYVTHMTGREVAIVDVQKGKV